MLNINARPTFTREITVAGGGGAPQSFTAHYLVKTATELEAFEGQSKDLLRAVVIGLDDVADEDGPVEFGPLLLEAMLDLYHLRNALALAYWAGLGDLAPKN